MIGSIGLALALVMVFEGILPFAVPQLWKRSMQQLASLDDGKVRLFGFLSLMAGLLLALAVH
ncbi:hypothetical protein GCM10007860_18920 [Chitiniphilus shinanonensis]|uniref:DUF2065 domain-containing protein n=1 Tax=Chitiniphilus shinanonensis TaxID=553088 RepID=A0ABQ6BTB4_9NEIS|nr:DUF2065 domain-containing protein [Chitiniphilus shinanonensis]GLS04744.1 hypothetical protein GCM10007860_18920 [Chitiniphilus shinanonensis]